MTAENLLVNSREIDFSLIVGKEIELITEQFPGQILTAKVISSGDDKLVLDKSSSSGRISQLIHKQNVEAHFNYKGEPVSFTSSIVSSNAGRIQIPIAMKIQPKVRRKFVRFNLEKDIRLTFFDDRHIKTSRLNKLKWIETATANISGGGMLAVMPTVLEDDHYVVLNLGFENVEIPHLILGRVCHSRRGERKGILVGVEFIIKEIVKNTLPQSLTRNLPSKIFLFDKESRITLARYLEENYGNNV